MPTITQIDQSSKPGAWVTVFVVLALALPITLLFIACRLRPSLRKYRRYIHRCQPVGQIITDEEKALRLRAANLSNEHKDQHSKTSRSKWRFTNLWWRAGTRKRPAMILNHDKDDQARGIKPSYSYCSDKHEDAVVSGASANDTGQRQTTVRRRRTNSSEKTRTSAYLEAIGATAVSKLIFGGTAKFEQIKKANKDIEAAFDASEDNTDDDCTVRQRRVSSLPSMHIKSRAPEQKTIWKSETAPPFTRIFDPPEYGVKAGNIHKDLGELQPEWPIEKSPEPAPALDLVCGPEPSVSPIMAQYRRDEVAARRSIEGYEAQDDLDNALVLRDITSSTNTNFSIAETEKFPMAMPDFYMAASENAPVSLDQLGRAAWQLASENTTPSQQYYTARSCAAVKTFPRSESSQSRLIRRMNTVRSEPRYQTYRTPRKERIRLHQDDPFYSPNMSTPPPTYNIPLRRKTKKTSQQISPVPKCLALFGLDGADDILAIPKARPSPRKNISNAQTPQWKKEFTIDDPASSSRSLSLRGNRTTFPCRQTRVRPASDHDNSDADNIFKRIDPELRVQHTSTSRPLTPSLERKVTGLSELRRTPDGDLRRMIERAASPSDVRYASAGLPKTREEFCAQKRKFSAPAEFERLRRRLRRSKGTLDGGSGRVSSWVGDGGGRVDGQPGGAERGREGATEGGRVERTGSEGVAVRQQDVTPVGMDGTWDVGGLKRGESKHRREEQKIIPSAPLT